MLSEELNENDDNDNSPVSLPNPMAHVTTLDYKKMSMNKLKEYVYLFHIENVNFFLFFSCMLLYSVFEYLISVFGK